MVGGYAAHRRVHPLVVAQDSQVVLVEQHTAFLDEVEDLLFFLRRGQFDPPSHDVGHSLIASGTGKNKENGGDQVFPIQHFDHLTFGSFFRPRLVGLVGPPVWGSGPGASTNGSHRLLQGVDEADNFRVHLRFGSCRGGAKQRDEPLPHHHVLVEGNRTDFADDDFGVTANGLQPVAKLFGVTHCRTQ